MLSRIRATTTLALEKGALQPIETECSVVRSLDRNQPSFIVRKATAVSKKENITTSSSSNNPFLPHDETLYIQEIAPAHKLLLNKYNVTNNHVLIVTKEFETQTRNPSVSDLAAAYTCLAEMEGVVFYNGGADAGASQKHKHLQMIPLVMESHGEYALPFDDALRTATIRGGVSECHTFPFAHAAVCMRDVAGLAVAGRMAEAAAEAGRRYEAAEKLALGMAHVKDGAVNVLATRQWMMVVPRKTEAFRGVAVNALGFVGCLLVRNDEGMQVVRDVGGMTVLVGVAYPRM